MEISPLSDAGHEHALRAGHGLRRLGALVWRTAKVCRTLRQAGRRRKAGARRTIMVLRECFAERGLTRFLPNMDAMLCRIDMHTGDLDAADAWYREKATCEPTHLNVMRRYRYLTQAAFYPHFLEPSLAPGEELTPTELQILHLLCADKSNAEIAQIMDVKLPTVKTHVSHILDKLDVKRRAEAKTAAKKLRLIPDDL